MYSLKYLKNKANKLLLEGNYHEIIELINDVTLNTYSNNKALIEIKSSAFILLGHNYFCNEDYHNAIKSFRNAQKANPNNHYSVNYNIAEAYLKLGNYRQAIITYNRLSKQGDVASVLAHSYLGNVYKELKQTDKAIKQYTTALKLYPYLHDTYTELGNIYLDQGKTDSAIEVFNEAIAIFHESWTQYYFRARCFEKLASVKEAMADYRKCISLTKKNPNYYTAASYDRLGVITYGNNKFSAAIQYYNKAIKLKPEQSYSYFNRALAYHMSGMWQDAIEDYQKYIVLSKSQPKNVIPTAQKEIRRIKRYLKNQEQEQASS